MADLINTERGWIGEVQHIVGSSLAEGGLWENEIVMNIPGCWYQEDLSA